MLFDFIDCMFGAGSAEGIEAMGAAMWAELCKVALEYPIQG